MNPITFAMRRPYTVMVLVVAVVLGSTLAVTRMAIDIFPNLNLPVIYVAQPYGGMDPAQMEGLLTNYYEYHFLYISGIHHVESRNVQGMAVTKLFFHPGTNMAQAMAETIGYVTRSRAFMPPGAVSPFITRFDAGSVPVGYLVLSSETRSIGEIQDQALFKVRPMFAGLPGGSAPPPFGGNQRTVVVRADPERLRSYALSPDELITALTNGNTISPSGNVRIGKFMPIVPINTLVRDVKELENIPIRVGANPTVYALADRKHYQPPVVHGGHHGDRRGRGQRDPPGHRCRTPLQGRRRAGGGRRRGSPGSIPADPHDQLRHDRRHGPLGPGLERRGRAVGTPGARSHWRPGRGDPGYPGHPPDHLYRRADRSGTTVGIYRSLRSPERALHPKPRRRAHDRWRTDQRQGGEPFGHETAGLTRISGPCGACRPGDGGIRLRAVFPCPVEPGPGEGHERFGPDARGRRATPAADHRTDHPAARAG
jgi:hypothetical protein